MTFSVIGLTSFTLIFFGIGLLIGIEIGERL